MLAVDQQRAGEADRDLRDADEVLDVAARRRRIERVVGEVLELLAGASVLTALSTLMVKLPKLPAEKLISSLWIPSPSGAMRQTTSTILRSGKSIGFSAKLSGLTCSPVSKTRVMASRGTAAPSNLTLCSAVKVVSLRRFLSEKRTPSAVLRRLLNV
jgi:hypothetical protein